MKMFRALLAAAAAGLALPAPGRADVPPPPADFSATTESDGLAGTVWSGSDGPVATVMVFHFEKGGVLSYSYNGNSYRNGTWKQTGNSLYLEMNNKFRECQATVRGNHIEGDSWNKPGLKWKTSMQRTKSAP